MFYKIQLYNELECPECEGTGTRPNFRRSLDCDVVTCKKCGGEGYYSREAGQVSLKEFKKMLEGI